VITAWLAKLADHQGTINLFNAALQDWSRWPLVDEAHKQNIKLRSKDLPVVGTGWNTANFLQDLGNDNNEGRPQEEPADVNMFEAQFAAWQKSIIDILILLWSSSFYTTFSDFVPLSSFYTTFLSLITLMTHNYCSPMGLLFRHITAWLIMFLADYVVCFSWSYI
jgi:hypothetical protein